jgi:hypothetical protein
VENTKIMRISSQPYPIKIRIDQKQLENMEYFNYLGSMITNDARCTREIKSRIAMAKAAEDEGEGVSSYWITVRKREDIGNCKRKH